jgi:integrative and conjugative element protein (TIGR02256 family)
MSVEATLFSPLEVGGVLMGRWIAGQPRVTSVIGPGPKASHSSHGFIPDYDFQETAIARKFRSSSGEETYLGDWHTHPGANRAVLSRQDRQTLSKIARDSASQTTTPVMIILIGGPELWAPASFIGSLSKVFPNWAPARVRPVETQTWK